MAKIEWNPNDYHVCLGCGCLVLAELEQKHKETIHK